MPHTTPPQAAPHRPRPAVLVAGAIALAAATTVALLGNLSAAASSLFLTPVGAGTAQPAGEQLLDSAPLLDAPSGDQHRALGADGEVVDGVTDLNSEVPAVANLDGDLRDALRRAAIDADAEGVTFVINSGWRSPEYQDQLLDEAVAEYGSAEAAAAWVATADTSPHVRGDAVDVGHGDATAWLSTHGADYGLCQIYENEPWHYERRPEAVDHGCPAMYADPTHDPRMHQ
ncbi:hypothetical protein GCM10022198_02420 [Klugiella xanthotipulae]|uniref:D-alanyl-D-alanine carboxypeptidase-like protein n=1 Tax=Klugiella xanthotipulae TaxID=244735 RepID=A0A543I4U4_9MICO|nr:M15 family metallopeptidase [Klugiella xanthotipulae]TQM65623.1 D-alanyl-D-alanine carboxypeptidase-like protein [Klugiella xanthotipulae]